MLRAALADITQLDGIDAIVNATNTSLPGGGGVDLAIHRAAGPALHDECRLLGGCQVGKAKITEVYNLPYRFIIHTVGPIWQGGAHREDQLLTSCYRYSMQLAVEYGIRRIAFPSIATGAHGFPIDRAARIAVETVDHFATLQPNDFDLVEWALIDDKTFDAYDEAIRRYGNAAGKPMVANAHSNTPDMVSTAQAFMNKYVDVFEELAK